MTKQEEVIAVIDEFILAVHKVGLDGKTIIPEVSRQTLLEKLHSQGVVIKVEKELPDVIIGRAGDKQQVWGRKFIEGKVSWKKYKKETVICLLYLTLDGFYLTVVQRFI